MLFEARCEYFTSSKVNCAIYSALFVCVCACDRALNRSNELVGRALNMAALNLKDSSTCSSPGAKFVEQELGKSQKTTRI